MIPRCFYGLKKIILCFSQETFQEDKQNNILQTIIRALACVLEVQCKCFAAEIWNANLYFVAT